jgi:PAS domain S-box-containing protein
VFSRHFQHHGEKFLQQQVSVPTQPSQTEQIRPNQPGQTNVAMGTLSRFSDSIIEDVNVWLNVLDTQLNIVLWNHFAEAISGYSREEVIGHKLCWDWLYPDEEYRRAITTRTAALLERDGGLDYLETRIRCKNGDLKTILWNSRSLVNENGFIYGAITFGYDITDRKKAEEALQKAHNEISALYHVASVASASLDLDTILESSLECVLETMNSDKGFVHLWDEGNETLHLAAQQGLSPELTAQIDEVPSGKGLIGWVYTGGLPMLTPNLMIDPGASPAILSGLDNSYVGLPMRAKGKVVGVFSVLGKTGRQFRPDEVVLLTSIADQVGVAVENARLYQQAEQLAIMEERERLARDLHDAVTQSLYSLTLLAEASRRLIKSGELERASEYITRLGETAQETLKEIRLLVYKLRPPALEREGLVGAIQQRLGAVERRAGVKAHLIASDTIQLSAPLEEGLYRIAQEALNNALKHAKASSVTVRIVTADEHIVLEVEDNGIGINPETVDCREGMGMASMQERAKRLGGTMQVHSAPGQGTRVSVRVKINPV